VEQPADVVGRSPDPDLLRIIFYHGEEILFCRVLTDDEIKHHVVHSARQNLAVIVNCYWLNHVSVYQLVEAVACDIHGLQISFSHPLPDQIIPPDHTIFWIRIEVEKACLEMRRKVSVAKVQCLSHHLQAALCADIGTHGPLHILPIFLHFGFLAC